MTYVVNENCIRCKYQDCIEVCPVDCFYVGAAKPIIAVEQVDGCDAKTPFSGVLICANSRIC